MDVRAKEAMCSRAQCLWFKTSSVGVSVARFFFFFFRLWVQQAIESERCGERCAMNAAMGLALSSLSLWSPDESSPLGSRAAFWRSRSTAVKRHWSMLDEQVNP